ncbi:hypothetical protein D9613_009369 [Agrocybe pediades]|uniref:Uncharacterized protein n=1 Tax=Agrocybe pediades TaxID=84607 RepID=A0A8H4R4J6_9AGAR|nr:hypothetical protein D9613_009369 [Agrocybe pediades]
MPEVKLIDGLWYISQRLVIPRANDIRESIFRLAHDALGHFGFDKSYAALRDSFYWPNMRRDLEQAYVPSCPDCQRNKSSTTKPMGPLHPLPVPDGRGKSVALDFIGPLPKDAGFDQILTMTCRLGGSDIRIIPCNTNDTAEKIASLVFENWYCENGLPEEFISDRDKLFTSAFWKSLHKLAGVKLKMSTAFHPESDGASERTNKTVNQMIRFHVDRNQKGWVKALPLIRFNIMNSVNKSTGFSPFQIRLGRSPRIIPPLVHGTTNDAAEESPKEFLQRMEQISCEAQDNLLQAKIAQSLQANKSRSTDFPFAVGDRVRLSTKNRRREYMATKSGRVAKFMPRFDGPFTITAVDQPHSTVTLEMPNNNKNKVNVFHTSQVLPYKENDDDLFPSRKLAKPAPVIVDGDDEYFIRDIIDERRRGRGIQYLVRWEGYGPEENSWIAGSELNNAKALDDWLATKDSD